MEIRSFRRPPKKGEWIKKLISIFLKKKSNTDRSLPKKTPGRLRKKILKWGGIIISLLILYSLIFLPSVRNAEQLAFSESTIIYDRKALDGKENPADHILYVIHGDENREYIPLNEIPKHMIDATIAIEDHSFYWHLGFDIGGIIKAALNYFFDIGSPRGGSTITQQLVKNTFLSREKTLIRKFNELLLAIKMEVVYSKKEILEKYLNNIPYGNNAHGIEAASRTFFGKSARKLTLAESAILASLPVAPTKFSPYGSNKNLLMGFYEKDEEGNQVYKKGRKDLVLESMLERKMITEEQFRQAQIEARNIQFKKSVTDIKAPHFVFYIREKLEEKYGKEFLREGGLRIYTTIDPDLQNIAEKTIKDRSENFATKYKATNVAFTAIDPKNGQILAYVGGRDFFDEENDGQVDILTSKRQPGSSFKPYVYAAAFEKGYAPSTIVFDTETDFGGNYQPQNFDGTYMGPISFREALNRSLNIPAIKAAYVAGIENVMKIANQAGVNVKGKPENIGLSIGVGTPEVSPLEHISGFQVFVNAGYYYEPTGILEIRDAKGKVLEKHDPKKTKKEGINPEIAELVRDILTDETTRPTTEGFDWNTYLQLEGLDNGAKTGTSNRKIKNEKFDPNLPEGPENQKFITVPGDGWTIGFTPVLVAGGWVGNNDGSPMLPGATGMAQIAPIWKIFMTEAHKVLKERGVAIDMPYREEVPLQKRRVNKWTGKLATEFTPAQLTKEEVFASFSVPTELDDSVEEIDIDIRTGDRATSLTPYYAREKKFILKNIHDIRPDLPNWELPAQEWLKNNPSFWEAQGILYGETSGKMEGSVSTSPEKLQRRSKERRLRKSVLQETPQEKPKIKIISPRDGEKIKKGIVNISVQTSSKGRIKAVEYYFDEILFADSESYPWNGKINIPSSAEIGTRHKIKAVAVDDLGQTSEEAIEIILESDGKGPDIFFYSPLPNQTLPLSSENDIMVEAIDDTVGIKKAEFYFDNEIFATDTERPYKVVFIARGSLGPHQIKVRAEDTEGNISEKQIPIVIEREMFLGSNIPEILKAENYKDSVFVTIGIPETQNIEALVLKIQKNGKILFSLPLSPTAKIKNMILEKQGMGTSEIFLEFRLKEGDLRKSTTKIIDF